jgi:hypothetical protein
MQLYRGIGGIAPLFPKDDTMWRWVHSLATWSTYLRQKNFLFPLNRSLGKPQSGSGHFGEDKISWSCRDLNPELSSPYPSHRTDCAVLDPLNDCFKINSVCSKLLLGRWILASWRLSFNIRLWETYVQRMREPNPCFMGEPSWPEMCATLPPECACPKRNSLHFSLSFNISFFLNWNPSFDDMFQMNVYRFSMSWSRVLPTGDVDIISKVGLAYYNSLVNELIANGIEPMVSSSWNSRIWRELYDTVSFVVVVKVSEEIFSSFYITYKYV